MTIWWHCLFFGHKPYRMAASVYIFCHNCPKVRRIPIPALEQTGV